ncbi:phage tail tape measure protein [Lysinibacillus sp. NPDC096212]|uniref:phage tail tape measure protein n=1 Tax=Lysinibacillus sp. NPDC096212 TaxID=3364135 RepID=UPI0037F5538F
MAEIGSLEVSLSLNASNFNGTVAQVDRNLKAMGSELQVLKSKGSDYEKSIDGIAKKKDILARSTEAASLKLQEQRKKYDELVASGTATEAQIERQATAVNKAQTQYNNLERQLSEVTRQLQVQSSQWTQAGQQLQDVGNKMQSIGGGMTSVGKDLSMKVTAPIAALGAGAFKAAVDFESAFAGVRKTVDASEQEFAALEKGIRDMAKQMPVAATEIAVVAEAAGQLGIKKENILGFSETMIKLGTATNMSSDQAATALARLANITKMNQGDFDKLGSAIVALGNNFATTESEITDMALRLAGAGAQVGMSEADILGLSAALTSVGIQAEMGGSAFSRVMVNMQMAVSGTDKFKTVTEATGLTLRELQLAAGSGGKAFGTFAESLGLTRKELGDIISTQADLENFAKISGMTADEFKKAFADDAVGAIGAFVDGLGNAEASGTTAINMLQEMGITEIQLRDALLRAGGAAELFGDAVKTSNEGWTENNALNAEAAERYKTTAAQLDMMWNKIKDIGITIGDLLIPKVIALLDFIDPLVEGFAKWFSNLSAGTQNFILAIVGITAALGPVIVIIGTLISSIGSIVSAFGGLALAIGEAGGLAAFLAPTFAFLGTVFAALISPIGLTVAALVAGAVLIFKYWEPISDFFIAFGAKTMSVFNSVISTVTAFGAKMSEVPSMMMSTWSGALSAVTGLLESLKEKLSIVTDVLNISNAMDALKIALEAVASAVLMMLGPWGLLANIILKLFNHTTLLQDVFKMLKGEMSLDEVANNFSKSISGIADNISKLISHFVDMLPSIIDAFVMIVPQIILLAADIVTKLADGITKNLPLIVKTITSLIELITTTIATLIPQLVEVGVSILTTLINGIVTALPMIIEVVTQLIETLVSTLTTVLPLLIETGLTIVETLLNGIVTALPLIVESALNIIMSLVDGIIVALPALIEVGLSVITTLLEGIVAALPTIIEAALTIIIALVAALILLLPQIIEAGIQIIMALVDGLIQAIPAIIEAVLTLIMALVKAVIDLLPQLIDAGIKIVEALVEGLMQVLPQLLEAGITLITALVKAIIDLLPELLSAGAQLIVALVKGVLSILGQLLAAGGQLILGLLGKILSFTGQLLSAGATLIGKLVSGILSLISDVIGAGAKLITGLIEKILSFTKDLLSAGEDLITELIRGVKSKITDMFNIGVDIVQGLINGITSMISDVGNKALELGQTVIDKVSGVLQRRSPSRVMIAIGKDVGRGLAIGIDSTKDLNESTMKELGQLLIDVTKDNQAAVTEIADQAEKERTQIQKDAAAKKAEIEKKLASDIHTIESKATAKKRKLTTDENNRITKLKEVANDKILKLEQENRKKFDKINTKAFSDMVKKEEESASERLKVVKQYIDDKKSANELDIATEEYILDQSLKLFKDGTKEKIEVQKMYKKVTDEINKEAESINKTYVDNVKKLNDDYIAGEKKLTKEYEDEFNKRRNVYYSFAGLFDEVVKKEDVTGSGLINALQSQITAFEDWQKNITELAAKGIDQGLLGELREMGPKAGAEIAALNTLTDEQLQQYVALWKQKNEQARTQAEAELTGLKQNTEKQINELKIKTADQLRSYQNEWRNSMIALKGNVKNEMSEMPNIGQFAVSGLIDGMLSKQGELESAAMMLASIVSNAFTSVLDIHSPSRVMRGYGVNIGEGLILGINDMVGKVAGATRRLANAVADKSNNSVPGNTMPSTTTNNTENNYNLTVNSPKPLDPYETSRLSRNGWKEMALGMR